MIAQGPAPMWEMLLSLHVLRSRGGPEDVRQWRREVGARLPDVASSLLEFVPSQGYSPAFLRPDGGADFEQSLAALLSTPRCRVRAELAVMAARHPLSGLAAAIADGRGTLRDLGDAIRSYYQIAIVPYWPRIQTVVQTDVALRASDLTRHGLGEVFTGLAPQARWLPPVLNAPYPSEQELRLQDRGLLLLPSFFLRTRLITLSERSSTPVLVFPIRHDPARSYESPDGPSGHPITALLGRTRARLLTVVATGPATTTQLARRCMVSPASASQHTAVLRATGLITSRRIGGSVVHAITPLGVALSGDASPQRAS
jgi:DNA-binding transcriptional ArsR family regulator